MDRALTVNERVLVGVQRTQFVHSAVRSLEERIAGISELRDLWFPLGALMGRLEDEMRDQYTAMGVPEMIERMGLEK